MSKIASAYSFNHKEIVTLMLKDAGVHEGIWALSVDFRLGAGAFGPTPDEVAPTGFVSIQGIGLQRIDPVPPELPPLAFNASELNPPDSIEK